MLDCELIATDLDGTLLRSDKTVSTFTRQTLQQLRQQGVWVVPVTARAPHGLRPIAQRLGWCGLAICGNGALTIDLETNQVWASNPISAVVIADIVSKVRAKDPDVVFAALGPQGEWFKAEAEYIAASSFFDHHRSSSEMELVDWQQLVADPCGKLVMRKKGVDPGELLPLLDGIAGCEATVSGAPFVEIMAAGVSKGSALRQLVDHLGISVSRVWAFGDASNDISMLKVAGRSFAVANAAPEVQAVAETVIASNDDDAVASFLAQVLLIRSEQ